jgi:hypothetical protein
MSEEEQYGEAKVTFDSTGKITQGGHDIGEEDYWFMTRELREQFNCLAGRLYGIVDATMMNEKQNTAFKRLVKSEVWERYNDFVQCMYDFSKTPYKSGHTFGGMPDDQIN